MKQKQFEFPISATSTLRCRLVVHPTWRQFWADQRRAYQEEDRSIVAFCASQDRPDGEGVLAAIHLCIPRVSYGVIAHEAFHAALAWARYVRVDLTTQEGEELLVETAEHLFNSTVRACRAHGVKIYRR